MKKNIYLLDIDNTLLNNDQIKIEIQNSIKKVLGEKEAKHFWQHNDSFRENKKFVNFPAVIKEYCQENHKKSCDIKLSNIFNNIDFKKALYPKVPQVINTLKKSGEVYLFTEGDTIYQKLKMEKSGLTSMATGSFLFKHKLDKLQTIQKKFPGKKLIFVDDKPQTLIEIKKKIPQAVTIEACQGHYSKEDHIDHKKFDATIDSIAELVNLKIT